MTDRKKEIIHILHFGGCPLPPEVAKLLPDITGRHPGRWVLDLCAAQNRPDSTLRTGLATLVRRLPSSVSAVMDGVAVDFIASPAQVRLLRNYGGDRQTLARLAAARRPDIIHAHGFEDAYALAAQDSKLPYVITAQGLMFMIIPRLKPPLLSWLRVIRLYEHRALTRARHVIAKSDNVAAALKQRYPHLQLHYIPNTFDPRLLEIHDDQQTNRLVFVGAIERRKGFHLFNAALPLVLREIPDLSLSVVGDRGECAAAYEKEQLCQTRRLLGQRLTTYGRVPGLKVGRIVTRATALVAPSLEEMFGNQLIEALLVRTHGIVAENTGLAENARRFGNATVVPPDNPQALAQAIISILQQKYFPERETARRKIIDYMAPSAVAMAHRNLYERIMHERPR